MKWLMMFLLLVIVSLQLGCSTSAFVAPSQCLDQPSLILENVPDPEALSKSLLVVQMAALEKIKDYDAETAMRILSEIEDAVLVSDKNYAEIVAMVMTKISYVNTKVGAILFIAGNDINFLDKPIKISDCDKLLISMHLAKQRALISFYK